MPLVNIYTSQNKASLIKSLLPELRKVVAKKLSCGDRQLVDNEVSIRITVPIESSQIAETEVLIIAHAYPERIKAQDKICLEIKELIKSKVSSVGSVYVWLQLSDLGHSE